MAMTYGHSVDLLTHFLRDQDIRKFHSPARPLVPTGRPEEPQGLALVHSALLEAAPASLLACLIDAVQNGLGDFSDAQPKDFPERDTAIEQSLWYRQSKSPDKQLPDEPALFSFDNGISALSTLAWASPEGGAAASAGLTAFKDLADNEGKRWAWMSKLAEVSNPPANPYDTVVDKICSKIDNTDIRRDIRAVFVDINTVQAMLNQVLPNPKEARSVRLGAVQAHGLEKAFILGDRGLGAVFRLLDSAAWGGLLDAQADWVQYTVDARLSVNPSYAEATLSALSHAATTVVNGLLAYIYLYPLPTEAFDGHWDQTVADPKDPTGQRRLRYDPDAAVKATKNTTPPAYARYTAWGAVCILHQLIDPRSKAPNLVSRLKAVNAIWQKICNRLVDNIEFRTHAPAVRNNLWYLDSDQSQSTGITAEQSSDNDRPWRVVCDDLCHDGQVVCTDKLLNAAQADGFLEPYRQFKTALTQSWHAVVVDTSSFSSAFDSFAHLLVPTMAVESVGASLAKVSSLNSGFDHLEYPLVRGGDHHGTGLTYDDVFWASDAGQEAANDPRLPGFLSTSTGRDVCAYLAFVLNNYLEAYDFKIDRQTGANLLTFVNAQLVFLGPYQRWTQSVLGQFDTQALLPNGGMLCTIGDRVFRYADSTKTQICDPGYPQTIKDRWHGQSLPAAFEDGIDALRVTDGRLTITKGLLCARYRDAEGQAGTSPGVIAGFEVSQVAWLQAGGSTFTFDRDSKTWLEEADGGTRMAYQEVVWAPGMLRLVSLGGEIDVTFDFSFLKAECVGRVGGRVVQSASVDITGVSA